MIIALLRKQTVASLSEVMAALGTGARRKGKNYPRRATKNGEGPLRGWRGIDRDPPRVG